MSAARLEIASLQAQSAYINTQILTEFYPEIRYIDRVQQQVVTKFVTVKDDSACTINTGFVRLHDSVVNQVLISPEETDTTPSDIKLSDVSSVVKENYSTCQRTAQQLKSLQEWVRRQEKLWNENK
jgi:hypothetical protein